MQNPLAEQHKLIWSKSFNWLLAIISLAILVIQSAKPVRSNDLWWHMAIGRHILATGQFIVDHSIFTWTEATSYHVYNAWLSEITLYLIYITTGPIGLIVFSYVIFDGFFALATYFAIKRDIVYNPLVWVIITLGTVLSFFATLIQPELFSFAFMYITVGLYFIIRATGTRAWKLCYFFPIIVILWINSHGAFVMSTLFFAAMGMGELLNAQFNTTRALPIKLRLHLFIALVLCIIALFINPFGYHLPFYLLQNSITIEAEILEFSTNIKVWGPTVNSPPFYALDYLIAAMVVYVFLIWQQLKNKHVDWVVILAFIAYSFLFIKMVRTTHFLAPIFVFISLDLLAYKENSWAWPSSKQAKAVIVASSVALISIIGYRILHVAICIPARGSLLASPIVDYGMTAIEESEYIHHLPAVKKIGNTYKDGGYLMYRLWPTKLIMIDARYFPFKKWIGAFLDFEHGDNIQSFLAMHKPDVWLIDHENVALIEWFNSSKSWVPSFVGSAGIVFTPVSGTSMQTKISHNIEKTDSILALIAVFHTALVLKNWPLTERIHNQAHTIATNRPWCEQYTALSQDLQRAIIGMKAFYTGNYATTVSNLSQATNFLNLTDVATVAHTLLAQRAWNNNDYLTARTNAIESLRLQPKNVTNVYNAAIADWQYRTSAPDTIALIKDDITWQFLVDILLKHKAKIPPTQTFIIDIFTAMQGGTMREKPSLITPPVSTQQ